MITIVAKSKVKQCKKEEYMILAEELVRESRKEKGCKSYNLYEDMNDPSIFTIIEEWIDEEAIKLHNESKHFTAIIPKLSELREAKPEVNLYREHI
jgi:quinol monooxygenase YgiN